MTTDEQMGYPAARCPTCGTKINFLFPVKACADCAKPLCQQCRRKWNIDWVCKACWQVRQPKQ